LDSIAEIFRDALPAGIDFASIRCHDEWSQTVEVARGVLQPVTTRQEQGAMIRVVAGGGLGYAATSDLSPSGVRKAIGMARQWADRSAHKMVFNPSDIPWPSPRGSWARPAEQSWESVSIADKIALVTELASALAIDPAIVDWAASLWNVRWTTRLITSHGGDALQESDILIPQMHAVASKGPLTQTRTFKSGGAGRQAGMELVSLLGLREAAPELAREAIALLTAPNCPDGLRSALIAPDQMTLQIHESIGHPIEIDRILGDERNYAGTSFVTPDMFGSYAYGSEKLNIVFDPTQGGEMASYGWDDDGTQANKVDLIKDGILLAGLGGMVSQHRSGLNGSACSRSAAWNRPPLDRMANINMVPGDHSLTQLIERTEKGILLTSNTSWSIDDSRNKFQFGCEMGQLIENGELTTLVRNPNYRGISATFWRNLVAVGDESTFEVLGSPYCGKAEPNQVIRVGHAMPAALFRDVDVFGGV